MPVATALRSFQHGADRYKKGDPVEYDVQTLKALARSGLVSKTDLGNEPPPPAPVVAPPKPAAAKGKSGKKSSASPAAQASPAPTLPPLLPGVPPPLPDAQ